MPEQAFQRTVLITGGTSGIGLFAAKEMASATSNLVIAASRKPAEEKLPSNIIYQSLDLTSTSSIRSFVSSWSHGPISVLCLNAGMYPGGKASFTAEGIELAFATSYTGHALLFFLLKDQNLLTEDCRIISTTSAMHDPKAPLAPAAPVWLGPEGVNKAVDQRLSNPGIRYANAKLANIFFTYALARRVETSNKHWVVNAFEPGFAPGGGSKMGQEGHSGAVIWISNQLLPRTLWIFKMFGTVTSRPSNSGKQLARLAVGDGFNGAKGKYILLHEEKPSSQESYDVPKQEELWNWTIQHLGKDEAERQRFNRF